MQANPLISNQLTHIAPWRNDSQTINLDDLSSPQSTYFENQTKEIGKLFHQVVNKHKQEHKEDSFLQWFKNLSKIIFSRESTYRGLLEVFTDDLPAIIVEATRGKAAFLESILNQTASSSLMFLTPSISKYFAHRHSKKN